MTYRHTQIGYVAGGGLLLAGTMVFLIIAYVDHVVVGSILGGLLMLLAVFFGTLTIHIDGRALRWYFGPGVLKKSIPLGDIAAHQIVRNPVWYGWGIRYTPHGWLYNVSGLHAVEIRRGDGTALRLGTDEPERLAAALATARGAQA